MLLECLLNLHWPPSRCAGKCGVHRIFLVGSTLFSKRDVPLIHSYFLVTLTQGHQEKSMNFKKVRFILRRVYTTALTKGHNLNNGRGVLKNWANFHRDILWPPLSNGYWVVITRLALSRYLTYVIRSVHRPCVLSLPGASEVRWRPHPAGMWQYNS